MKGRDILKSLTEAKTKAPNLDAPKKTKAAGSVKALKSELDKITEQAAEAKSLRDSISKNGGIVELNPKSIEGATISDRIPFEFDPDFEALKGAIGKAGQQVPILVRPHPKEANRYQAAYGHRRLLAATQLGIQVKAIVRELTDEELVIAQGQENGSRVDLSYIERASYAARLLLSGYDRTLICQALGIDKSEVSRLLSAAKAINPELMAAIGPAPQVGRARWSDLTKALATSNATKEVMAVIAGEKFLKVRDSNERFNLILKTALAACAPKKPKLVTKKQTIQGLNGEAIGWHQAGKNGMTLSLQNRDFSKFLVSKLPELISEYGNGKKDE
ncbi:plasmid partitioning protein RepB [uncultured Roseibium sp.]|uniref:plasmid partitioning protein RepB n=1 Tax=uncultured Roseibium sp. TaxID=1936171 RepID=UPI002634B461|nr:plasmid partitioning protein RepB [uncultured Roseibium sp.]